MLSVAAVDVGAVTFQSEDSFVEFIIDTVKDVSFSFLPTSSRHHTPSPADLSEPTPAAAAAAARLILLALGDDNNRSLSVYISRSNDNKDIDNNAESQLIVERRHLADVDRVNASLAGAYFLLLLP